MTGKLTAFLPWAVQVPERPAPPFFAPKWGLSKDRSNPENTEGTEIWAEFVLGAFLRCLVLSVFSVFSVAKAAFFVREVLKPTDLAICSDLADGAENVRQNVAESS